MVRNKMNKREFLEKVARDNGLNKHTVSSVYNALVDGICDTVSDGTLLSLTGFGVFSLQVHKGHPIRFEGRSTIDDYVTFKFDASDTLVKRIRKNTSKEQVAKIKAAG